METRFFPCRQPAAHSELLLVEGQSALHALQGLRQQHQAVLALQGKLPNALKRSAQAIGQDAQCRQLFSTLDCGSGPDCSADRLRYGSVIIVQDPDIDGAHCRYLLLLLFQQYLLPLIAASRIAVVSCPLYRLAESEPADDQTMQQTLNPPVYFWSEQEKLHYINTRSHQHQVAVTRFKGLASLNSHELLHWVIKSDTRRERRLSAAAPAAAERS